MEIQALVRAGLSPTAALAAATSGGATALGLDGEVGSTDPGARADLVVWTRDPLADVGAMTDPQAIRLVIQSKGLTMPWS